MTGQKGARWQAPPALGLELVNRQDGALATGDTQPVGAGFDDLTMNLRRGGIRRRLDAGPEN